MFIELFLSEICRRLVSSVVGKAHAAGHGDNETLYQEGGRHVNEQAVLIQDVDEGQIVSHSNLVVVMVVGWGDFDST